MGKPSGDLRIENNHCDRLRVVIKADGEEVFLSGGEVASVFVLGEGSEQPQFSLVTRENSIDISASHAAAYLLVKETPESRNFGKSRSGVWDRELDGGA